MLTPDKVRASRGSGQHQRRRDATPSTPMAAEVRAGLSAQPLPWLPSKYSYDDRGSALFERITRLPEYYQTRTEEGILERVAGDVVAATRPVEFCELGSGVGRKVRLLLDAGSCLGTLERCVLLDINATVLAESVRSLEADYPGLCVRGVVGDFQDDLAALGPGGGRLALFLAGTIGNLHPAREVPGFLRAMACQLVPRDAFYPPGALVVPNQPRVDAITFLAVMSWQWRPRLLEHRWNRRFRLSLLPPCATAEGRGRSPACGSSRWVRVRSSPSTSSG